MGDFSFQNKAVLCCFCIYFGIEQIDLSLFVQVSLVAEERDRNINRVQELEASITELKNAAGKSFT